MSDLVGNMRVFANLDGECELELAMFDPSKTIQPFSGKQHKLNLQLELLVNKSIWFEEALRSSHKVNPVV